jgi:hypothetical protein
VEYNKAIGGVVLTTRLFTRGRRVLSGTWSYLEGFSM